MNKEAIISYSNELNIDSDNLDTNEFDYYVSDYLRDNFRSASGVTKGVIIPTGALYVIKFPFYREEKEYCDGYEDEDGNWIEPDEDNYYNYFENAPFSNGYDYCLSEVMIYRKAKKAGVAEAFCKTKFIGKNKNNSPIYIQQRATTFDNSGKRNVWDSKNYSEEQSVLSKELTDRKLREFNIVWQNDVVKYYGKKFLFKLMNFLKINGLTSDLHSGNIGYLDNGRPVLIDYSSFEG